MIRKTAIDILVAGLSDPHLAKHERYSLQDKLNKMWKPPLK